MEHTAKIAGVNLQNAALCTTAGLREQFPCDGLPQFAFSGRSNVGKSSLINTLLGRKKLSAEQIAQLKKIVGELE